MIYIFFKMSANSALSHIFTYALSRIFDIFNTELFRDDKHMACSLGFKASILIPVTTVKIRKS